MGAVVLDLSAYAGYRTYDAYNGVIESELLLAIQEFMGCDCYRSIRTCRIYVGATGCMKLLDGKILEVGG